MLDAATLQWINQHICDDPIKLRLKYASKKENIDYDDAILQIECRRRFHNKLSETLKLFPSFYFPSKLAGEQATSDLLAKFHTSLITKSRPLLDLTSGLGIDVMHCSHYASSTTAVEQDARLCRALQYNSAGLHCPNLTVINDDCTDYLQQTKETFGTIFIDPARRATDGNRVFALSDCQPDITAMLPTVKTKCQRLIIKMSPMLDISHTFETLGLCCKKIIALGTTTECKELLAICEFDAKSTDEQIVESITLTADKSIVFSYNKNDASLNNGLTLTNPTEGDYIYEPYPSTMKIGGMPIIANKYRLGAFHPNTRLFHAGEINDNFPGECFRILKVLEYSSKNIKRIHNEFPQLSVSTRNFGVSADQLRKQLKVRDGGDTRLFALTGANGKRIMIIAR